MTSLKLLRIALIGVFVVAMVAVFGPQFVHQTTRSDKEKEARSTPHSEPKERILLPKLGPRLACVTSRKTVTYMRHCVDEPYAGYRFVTYTLQEESNIEFGTSLDERGRTVIWPYDKPGMREQDITLAQIKAVLNQDRLARGERTT